MKSSNVYNNDFYRTISDDALESARALIPLLNHLFSFNSVVDVGCGIGAWLKAFQEYGMTDILGLDGEYCLQGPQLLIPPSLFLAVDLTKPFVVERTFDLAISLEVAEHLPRTSAENFIRSLCKLSSIVLFSAAVPNQIGTNHLNLQWPSYWQRMFATNEFLMLDPLRYQIWHDNRIKWWYRQNIFVFIRSNCDLAEEMKPFLVTEDALTLVKNEILMGNIGLRASVRRLPNLLWRALLRRLNKLHEAGY